MFLKSNFYRAVCVLSLALSLAVATFADTIRLKDGSIIKGKIVSFGGGRFTVVINDGARRRQMNFNSAEVESISFETDSAVRTSSETASNVENNSVNASISNPNQVNDPQTSSPKTNSNGAPVLQNNSPAAPSNPLPNSPPITINVKVLADNTSNGWTNSGFVVRKGQRIKIISTGRVSLGGGRYTTPEGISSLPDAEKLMQSQPTGGLIAVLGDDNNDFIFLGAVREFTATRDGSLFLGVNEGNLNDNSGVFEVRVQIFPNN